MMKKSIKKKLIISSVLIPSLSLSVGLVFANNAKTDTSAIESHNLETTLASNTIGNQMQVRSIDPTLLSFTTYQIDNEKLNDYITKKVVSFGRTNPAASVEWLKKSIIEQEKKDEEAKKGTSTINQPQIASPKPSVQYPAGQPNKEKIQNIQQQMNLATKEDIFAFVVQEAEKNSIDAFLVLAVMTQENSGFDPNLEHVNKNGSIDYGLMQVNSATAPEIAKRLGVKNFKLESLKDPVTNIRFGMNELKLLVNKYPNDMHHVLTAYNRGQAGAERYKNDVGTYESEYSKGVLSHLADLFEEASTGKLNDQKNDSENKQTKK